MKIKELLENRHGYDDAGYSLAPGHDEGEPVYSKYHDRIGDGGPNNYRQQRQYQADVPHDVHINGRKWKSFGSHSHASNVAKKIKGATVHKATEGAPELLKKEMPLHRHAEKLLAQNGVSKDDPDYHHHLGNTIKHLRQFGNIDLINKSDEQGVAEGAQQAAIAIAKKASGKYDKAGKRLKETATAGATSAANVGVGAVYKNKPVKQPKNKDGTAKNALDINANLLTGGSIKRS